MKAQSVDKYNDLASISLYLGMLGLLTSVWFLLVLSQIWGDFLMWYLYSLGIFMCTPLSTFISLIGLIMGIAALKRRLGKKRVALAGIVLGTIGTFQILMILAFLLNPGPIVWILIR